MRYNKWLTELNLQINHTITLFLKIEW
jgi:hypothetical protein